MRHLLYGTNKMNVDEIVFNSKAYWMDFMESPMKI